MLVVDSWGDPRAASAGDLYIGRLEARGCAGIVTDGGLRDSEGILKVGLPAYLRRASSPPSPIVHQAFDLNLPIGCGGVAVYPGDIVVGDCDGVVIIPLISSTRWLRRFWERPCMTSSPKKKLRAAGPFLASFRVLEKTQSATMRPGS